MTLDKPLFLSEPRFLCPEVEEVTVKVLQERVELFLWVWWRRAGCEDQDGQQDSSQPVDCLLGEGLLLGQAPSLLLTGLPAFPLQGLPGGRRRRGEPGLPADTASCSPAEARGLRAVVTLPSPRVPRWWEDPLRRAHLCLAAGVDAGAGQSLPPDPA